MKILKHQIYKALRLAMAEHKWSPVLRKTFKKSFEYYLKEVTI